MGETRRPIPNGPLTGGAFPAVVDVFPSRWPSDETAVRELAAALAAAATEPAPTAHSSVWTGLAENALARLSSLTTETTEDG